MKVIGICGSPRTEGNTEFYLNIALEEIEKAGYETELIRLNDKKIDYCKGCYKCVENKRCIIEDDFQEIFDKMMDADGILFGSPVYHSSITPCLKSVLDRAGFSGRWYVNDMKEKSESYDWKGTAFSGKVIAPVTVARRAGQNFAFAQILLWATVNDCIVVGSNYWNVGVAGKGGAIDAKDDLEGIGILKHLANNMNYVIRRLK
jgi:multimeric flavodoxin WrbA